MDRQWANHRIMKFRLLLAVLFVTGAGMAEDALAEKAPPVIILVAHRGGKPDNTEEAIKHAIEVGMTAVEMDLRLTADRKLVLSHDFSWPRRKFFPDASPDERISISKTSSEELSSLRYSEEIDGTKYTDLRFAFFEDMMLKYLPLVNFDIHIAEETPPDLIFDLLDKHNAWSRVIIHTGNFEILKNARKASPQVSLLWAQRMLGRSLEAGKYGAEEQKKDFDCAVEKFAAIGGGILCIKEFPPELIDVCHKRGILVMPSVSKVGDGAAEDWLILGVDAVLGNSPENMRQGVDRIFGQEYLPSGNRDIVDILRTFDFSRAIKCKTPVVNGGFELMSQAQVPSWDIDNPERYLDIPDGWHPCGTCPKDAIVKIVKDNAYKGRNCVMFDTTKVADGMIKNVWLRNELFFPAVKGRAYEFSVFLKTSPGSKDTPAALVLFGDSVDGKFLFGKQDVMVTPEWTQHKVVWQVPQDGLKNDKLSAWIELGSKGTIFADEADIQELVPPDGK